MRNRESMRRGGAALLVAGAALLAGGCGKEGDAAPAAEKPAAVVVGPENVFVVVAEEITTGPQLSGNLSAEREAQVRAQAAGTVVQVFAEKGQRVSAGQVLARIDDASLADAVTSARSGVTSAQTAVELATRNVERSRTLAQAGAIPERDLETALNQQKAAQAQLADARARLSSAQKSLSNTAVRAPIGGVVSDRPVNAGDVVQPGAAMFTIVDPGSMRLEASVAAAQLSEVRQGAPVRFTVSGYPGRTFTGTVARINPAADPATGQVPVTVSIPNAEGALVSGLFAEGRVASAARQGLTVPATGLDERGVSPTVLRLKGGVAQRAPVQVGARNPDTERVEVLAGLEAGDTVLVGGASTTEPGTPVQVRSAPAATANR